MGAGIQRRRIWLHRRGDVVAKQLVVGGVKTVGKLQGPGAGVGHHQLTGPMPRCIRGLLQHDRVLRAAELQVSAAAWPIRVTMHVDGLS